MKTLPKPLLDIKVEDIYAECVQCFSNKQKREKLLSCKDLVINDSNQYDNFVPHTLESFSVSKLPQDVSKDDLTSVYTQKFAVKDSPGRKYYDAIIGQAIRGICPICGIRPANTLDHYLPKSKVPTLSITPNNLIPACRDCNTDKRADIIYDSTNTPIHLYFDTIPNDPWLFVELDDNLSATYYTNCPDTWNVGLRSRVEKHLTFYNLHKLYSIHAGEEIADKLGMWKKLIDYGGIEMLRLAIEAECKSIEQNDINSWKAALYRGLISDFEKLKAYFFNQGIVVTN